MVLPQIQQLGNLMELRLWRRGKAGKPFDAPFILRRASYPTRSHTAPASLCRNFFPFRLSHGGADGRGRAADEGLHLSAAVEYAEFWSVVGMMWTVANIDGPTCLRPPRANGQPPTPPDGLLLTRR